MTELTVRVYYEDTDFSGRVYHGAYVRFLERARTEMLREAGIDHAQLAAGAVPLFFTLRALALTFRAPATIDDLLTVTADPAGARRATLVVAQRVLNGTNVVAEASAELCLIDRDGRPRRPPPAIAERFAA